MSRVSALELRAGGLGGDAAATRGVAPLAPRRAPLIRRGTTVGPRVLRPGTCCVGDRLIWRRLVRRGRLGGGSMGGMPLTEIERLRRGTGALVRRR